VCIPILSLICSFGRCLIVNLRTASRRESAIRAISRECKIPFRIGNPVKSRGIINNLHYATFYDTYSMSV